MHPVLFELGSFSVYSYGFMIALGAAAGVAYLAVQGKREAGLTFDQANTLFLIIFFAAIVGGKVFLFFEDPSRYTAEPSRLFTGTGFVFYGSFIFAVPAMLWYFRKSNLGTLVMLDIMAVVTCIVHIFGRVGCFLAGCCHGMPSGHFPGVIFTDPQCYADPKGIPLHPVQLYEAGFILLVMGWLIYRRARREFFGELFSTYLICYAVGRFMLEYLRGDEARGYIFGVSHSQLIALAVFAAGIFVYRRWSKKGTGIKRPALP